MNQNPNGSSSQKPKAGVVTKIVIAGIGGFLLIAVGYAAVTLFPNASNQGYEPDQPIPFSHKLHAGQYNIDCQYCHVNPERSRHSTVPAVATCMNCHTVVKTDSPYIKQIQEAYKSGKPIEWVRVHELPDHAYFPHKAHVGAGLACQTCHGDVQKMDKVFQYAPLTMGWCMDCHRGISTPADIKAKFTKKYEGSTEAGRHEQVAPISCWTCHN